MRESSLAAVVTERKIAIGVLSKSGMSSFLKERMIDVHIAFRIVEYLSIFDDRCRLHRVLDRGI